MTNEYEYVLVFLPLKLDKPYYYKVQKTMNIQKGDIVLVPLRNEKLYGIVYSKHGTIDFEDNKLKEVLQKQQDIPSLDANLMLFLNQLSSYTISNFGNVLKMAIAIAGIDFYYEQQFVKLNSGWQSKNIKITSKRQQVIEYLFKNDNNFTKKELAQQLNVSLSLISELIKLEVLREDSITTYSNFQENIKYKPCNLREEQQDSANSILELVNENKFNVSVLQGVPGSGKTEVYFEVMAKTIREGKQVLIMLPEIALSTQIISRFKDRFGVEPYVWHSSISKKQKKDTWVSSHNGNLKVIIGARSSLFLPFSNLGLIIVDEEHDQSYKQEEGVIYNARDMAVLRAKIHNIPIILSSATPSLETINNVINKKYFISKLLDRHNLMALPKIEIIDMKEQTTKKGEMLSSPLVANMEDTLNKNEQVLLFLNRRGYASCVLCKSCGEKLACKHCVANLVKHKSINKVMCHYCGHSEEFINHCSNCESDDSLILLGTGVERLQEEVQSKFPSGKILIISSDTINSHSKAQNMVQSINNYEYNILIGTQIISKGYHFPKLTTVGIIDGDSSSSLDLKGNEKTWQLLYQVAGRSGRGSLEGRVILQTYNPNNIIFESLKENNYEAFIAKEIEDRKLYNYPPFGKLVAIIISSKNKQELDACCEGILRESPKQNNVEILGYCEAPLNYLRGYYRNRFLVKTNVETKIQIIIKDWFKQIKLSSGIKIQIDVDPISFY